MVEETISLSNISQRQIKIKPIYPHQQDIQMKEPTINESNNIFEQIERAKTDLMQLKQQKKQLIDSTKQMIEEDKKRWSIEKKKLIEQAQKEGYKVGFVQGEQKGLEQYDSAIEHINDLSHKALEDYHQTIAQAEPDILQIAVNIAEKIIHHTLKNDVHLFHKLVKEAITNIENKQIITIYVPEQQYEMMLKQKEELMRILDQDSKLLIKLNKDLPEFGCQIEHQSGMLDVGIDTQLNEIRHVLNEFVMENSQ